MCWGKETFLECFEEYIWTSFVLYKWESEHQLSSTSFCISALAHSYLPSLAHIPVFSFSLSHFFPFLPFSLLLTLLTLPPFIPFPPSSVLTFYPPPLRLSTLFGRNHSAGVTGVSFHDSYPLFASSSADGSAHVFHGRVFADLLQNPLIVPLKILRGETGVNKIGGS